MWFKFALTASNQRGQTVHEPNLLEENGSAVQVRQRKSSRLPGTIAPGRMVQALIKFDPSIVQI